jgi:hypothetical protein
MSKKKSSIEASIVEFFTTADPAAKQTLFNVIQGLMKNNVVGTTVAPVKVTRGVAKPKAVTLGAPAPVHATAVDTVDQAAA